MSNPKPTKESITKKRGATATPPLSFYHVMRKGPVTTLSTHPSSFPSIPLSPYTYPQSIQRIRLQCTHPLSSPIQPPFPQQTSIEATEPLSEHSIPIRPTRHRKGEENPSEGTEKGVYTKDGTEDGIGEGEGLMKKTG